MAAMPAAPALRHVDAFCRDAADGEHGDRNGPAHLGEKRHSLGRTESALGRRIENRAKENIAGTGLRRGDGRSDGMTRSTDEQRGVARQPGRRPQGATHFRDGKRALPQVYAIGEFGERDVKTIIHENFGARRAALSPSSS